MGLRGAGDLSSLPAAMSTAHMPAGGLSACCWTGHRIRRSDRAVMSDAERNDHLSAFEWRSVDQERAKLLIGQ